MSLWNNEPIFVNKDIKTDAKLTSDDLLSGCKRCSFLIKLSGSTCKIMADDWMDELEKTNFHDSCPKCSHSLAESFKNNYEGYDMIQGRDR